MSASNGATRRRFLVGLAVFGAGGVALWFRRESANNEASGPLVSEAFELALAGVAAEPAAAREIGAAYLAAVPSERTPGALTAAIFAGDSWQGVSAQHASQRFRAQVRGDFEAGRTIALAGWVLALSEARACALVELLARSGRLDLEHDG